MEKMGVRVRVASPAARVLVVDDDPSTRMLMQRVLNHEGYSVRGASSVEDGLTVASEWAPRLMIVDAHLGRGDGRELVRMVRERLGAYATAFLFCTGDLRVMLEPAPVLLKPFRIGDLVRVVGSLASRTDGRPWPC